MTAASSAGAARSVAHGVTSLLLAALLGCAEPETIELVAIPGCGLDQEFSGLRVRVLGDFPASAGTEVLLGPGERGQIPALPDAATGVAAEGLFGTTVTAVGRSYGVDPTLAIGRVPGHEGSSAILPVWFAAPDSACELDSQPSPRSDFAAAVGPAADLLLVGGRGSTGAELDELVHVDLLSGEARTLEARLPSPRRGASVHALGGRSFAILGGADGSAIASEPLIVDVAGDGQVTARSELLPGVPLAVFDHATATAPDGRALLAGGCEAATPDAACVPGSERATAYWIDFDEPSASVRLPDLDSARARAQAIVSEDGVAYLAGGTLGGLELPTLERLLPDGAWQRVYTLPDAIGVAGLAALDGGLVLLSDRLGSIHWWSEAGCGVLDSTSTAPALAAIDGERPLLTLPGERVLVDAWLFAPGTAGIDPALERVALADAQRSGARMLALADGSVLIAGGRFTQNPDALAEPPLLRLRPELDGPDERIPDLTGPQTDAFVSNAPGFATVIVGGVRLDPVELDPELVGACEPGPVRAHVRGFRSGALRLEFEFEADPETVAELVLGQGTVSLVTVELHEDALVVRRRDPSGAVEPLDCAFAGVGSERALIVELDDHARHLRVSGAELLADCELAWPSDAGVSVGFGVQGSGSARFFMLRLARR